MISPPVEAGEFVLIIITLTFLTTNSFFQNVKLKLSKSYRIQWIMIRFDINTRIEGIFLDEKSIR